MIRPTSTSSELSLSIIILVVVSVFHLIMTSMKIINKIQLKLHADT